MSQELLGVFPNLQNEVDRGVTSRSRSGDRVFASAIKNARLHSRIKSRGFWDMECFRGITVLDPAKVESVLAKYGINFVSKPEMLHHGFVEKTLRNLRMPDQKDLEKVLAGGGLAWKESWENLVVNEGLDNILDSTLGNTAQVTAWFVGLISTLTTIAAGDTAAKITSSAPNSPTTNNWREDTNYSESVRQTWTKNGASSGQSVTNSSSKATFSMNGSTTINGAFLDGSSTKGGTSSKLYAAGSFSARSVVSGDTLLVTGTFTSADDGV